MPKKGSGVTSVRRLKARCTVQDPKSPDCCWLWKWATRAKGQAAIHVVIDGKDKIISGPWAALHFSGKTPAPRARTWARCRNKLCCNPAHAMSGTYAEFGQWQRENGVFLDNPRRLAAATHGGRMRSAINLQIAREMRASPLPATKEAAIWSERLGRPVSHDVVSDLRRGKSWQEPNPFAGLMGRSVA